MDRPDSPAIGLITSKDWTLEYLLASGSRFRGVDTISAKSGTPEQIASTVKDYEQHNVPLVVQDLHHHPNWPEFFTPQWLESHCGSQRACISVNFAQIAGTNLSCLSGRSSQCPRRKAG